MPLYNPVMPSGVVVPFASLVAPGGWLLCYGQTISRTTYSTLFNAIVPTLGTFTVTIASPAVVTLTAHGLRTGDQIYMTTTGALPTGLAINTIYYVNVIDANTFRVCTTQSNAFSGTYINTTGTQSGTHTATYCPYGLGDGTTTFTIPDLRGYVPAGKDDMGGSAANRLNLNTTQGVRGYNLGNVGGEQSHTLITSEIPAHVHSLATSSVGAGGGGGTILGGVGSSNTNSTGSDGTHNNVQPTNIFSYIIKV